MLTKPLLLALAAAPLTLAHLLPRQTSDATAAPATSALPAASTAAPEPTITPSASETPSATPTPTSTTPTINLAACELAIDTLLREFLQIPTPNAALSSYLATETATVHNGCSWVADAPSSLSGAMSAYSTDVVSLLNQFTELVDEVEGCIATGGATVTRQELMTPVFALAGCSAAPTASGTTTSMTMATSTSFSSRGFPTSTGSSAGAARATGVAFAGAVGAAAAALLGVVGGL